MAAPSKKRKIFDGRYEILSIVGRGSDSVVYHAKHVSPPQQEVALKVLLSPKDQKDKLELADRLRKEALTLVSCRHRYVVRLDDFHSIGELCYLSMEFARESDLRKYSQKLGGKIPLETASRFFQQCLEAFDYIHTTGILHRDVKPDNILVVSDAEIRLGDFGLSLLPGDEPLLEELRNGVGTFAYLPPEMLEGIRYDHRSDLYALAVCFYEMISGRHPFEKAPLAMQMEARQDGNIPSLRSIQPDVPEVLDAVLMKMLRFDASNRFGSALDALRVLTDETVASSFLESERGLEAPNTSADTVQMDIGEYSSYVQNVDEPLSEQIAVGDDLGGVSEPPPVQSQTHSRAERIPPPTEKIDLERIKEIIAKDQQRAADATARRAGREKNERPRKNTPSEVAKNAQYLPASVAAKKAQQLSKGAEGFMHTALAFFNGLPNPLKPLVAGFGAALVVVCCGAVIRFVMPSGEPVESAKNQPTTVVDNASNAASATTAEAGSGQVFAALKAGMYAGEIEGLIPGRKLPFTILSFPTKEKVAVIVGLEGWQPVMVATHQSNGSPVDKLRVASGGYVLNLAGDLSSKGATGSFLNSLTGDSGEWKVSKVGQN